MIENFLKESKGNQKTHFSVSSKMENSFEALFDFFENGNDPMFIIDLASHQFLNLNKEFVKKHSEIERAVALFIASIENNKPIVTEQFEHNGKVFLFNPIFKNQEKALIQILEVAQNIIPKKINGESASHHVFEDSLIEKKLLDKLPSGIIHTNKKFEALWFNAKFNLLFGRQTEEKFNFIDAIYVRNISQFWDKIDRLNNGEEQVSFSFVIHNIKKSEEIFINATAFSVDKSNQLQEGYIFILENNTENLNFSEEITKQNLALNQINHELDKFLYSVSHNIRGPIASLEGLLKVIEISDVKTVDELKHHLRLNLRLLNSFVSDISNVATNIHTHVNFKEVNLLHVIHEMLLFVDEIYGLDPIINIDIDESYTIKTDPDRLGIIFKYLLKNSFQYRDKRKDQFEINISVKQNEEFHLVEITDNGIGISDKVKPFIFDMFYRGTELSNGNGMGLYNSREILKKLGGTMNVDSKERYWTKAKIYLPVNI